MTIANDKRPDLVSVIVVTYNSSKFVIETLESVRYQTYNDIELIITDDNSSDNTISLCEDWISKNKDRFVRVKVIRTDINTGIAGNINRGIIPCQGKWIKLIAGDDIIEKSAIEKYIRFINNVDCNVVGAMRASFVTDISNAISTRDAFPLFNHKNINASQQYEIALRGGSIPIITLFVKKDYINKIGLFDETIPMTEDKPFKLKVLKSGEKIHYVPLVTMYHRKHEQSVSSNNNGLIYTSWQVNSLFKVNERDVLPNVSFVEQMILRYEIGLAHVFYRSFFNSSNMFSKLLHAVLGIPIRLSYRFFRLILEKRISNEIRSFK